MTTAPRSTRVGLLAGLLAAAAAHRPPGRPAVRRRAPAVPTVTQPRIGHPLLTSGGVTAPVSTLGWRPERA
jgi:hypothetical protein